MGTYSANPWRNCSIHAYDSSRSYFDGQHTVTCFNSSGFNGQVGAEE